MKIFSKSKKKNALPYDLNHITETLKKQNLSSEKKEEKNKVSSDADANLVLNKYNNNKNVYRDSPSLKQVPTNKLRSVKAKEVKRQPQKHIRKEYNDDLYKMLVWDE